MLIRFSRHASRHEDCSWRHDIDMMLILRYFIFYAMPARYATLMLCDGCRYLFSTCQRAMPAAMLIALVFRFIFHAAYSRFCHAATFDDMLFSPQRYGG